ncbi:MAG: PaaI family thioesterase [Marinobacter sp.]|uniref:PaaI family thioesterase n=1 Tax=Marinobacter sp. TaxID=50741 RepID=UPI00299DD606|nr:PaaI family thioesterase [Marinobacter sp.]MDX1633046.1 PaaI family thioesterase [Marinobacter sp.]
MTATQVQALISDGLPMADEIGFTVERVRPGFARTRVPHSDRNIRPGGTLSGPLQMALADAAMYAAILASLDKAEMAMTSNLSINFLQKPAAADLIGEATVLRMGRRLAVCEVRLLSPTEDGEVLVAHVTGSYALPTKA